MALGGLIFAFDGDEFYGDLPTVMQYYEQVSKALLRKRDMQALSYLRRQVNRFFALSVLLSGTMPVLFVPFAYRSKERLYLVSTQTLSVFSGTRSAGEAGRISNALYASISRIPEINKKAYYFLHAFLHEQDDDIVFIGSYLEEPDEEYES